MSRKEIAQGLNMTHAEVTQEARAVFFWMSRSVNYRHMNTRQLWAEVQALLTNRVQRRAQYAKMVDEMTRETESAHAEFAAADCRAGWL